MIDGAGKGLDASAHGRRSKPLVKGTGDLQGSLTSVKDGGNQIEFEDEDPRIHNWFLDDLKKSGAECVMCDYFPNCPKK